MATERNIRRIGVTTGGGDCPGLNAVIRGVVKSAICEHGWDVIGIEDGFDGLLKPGKTQMLELKDVNGILNRGGTILGTTNRGNPFKYPVERNGEIVPEDLSKQVVDNIKMLRLDALIVIGGDGTLSIANDFYKMGVPVVGVPKTIDNDLSATEITFGFDTALNTATDAIDKIQTTAESHHRVMLVEVMGRNSGWIAIEAGIAGGADIILIPEIPYDIEAICKEISKRQWEGCKSTIIVVAEGAKPIDGEIVAQAEEKKLGIVRLGGVAQVVADEITKRTKQETRVTVLGHLQRGGSPSPFDRILSSRYGTAAVKLVANGEFGKMVSLRPPNIVAVPIEEAIGVVKKVSLNGDMVRTAKSLGILLGVEENAYECRS